MTNLEASNEQDYSPSNYLSSYFGEVQNLSQEDRIEEVIASLLELVDATEEDSIYTGLGVASVYYEQLAQIFRARKEYAKEIAILARYAKQKHTSRDSRQEILKARLEKAKELISKKKSSIS